MKLTTPALTAAVFLFLAAEMPAQTTGTSHPEALNDDVVVTTTTQTSTYAKPSPAVPMLPATEPTSASPALHTHEYTPAPQTYSATAATRTTAAVPQPTLVAHEDTFIVTDDVNSGVVTEVPWRENEVPEATFLRTKLSTNISTDFTRPGSQFQARLTHAVEHHGKVILPVGTLISGRITDLHGGRRISGAAYIHLQPDTITLPDGATQHISAQVVDLAHPNGTHVNDEGTIIGNDHSKGTMAALGLTTASSMAAGAVIGGGVGAVVGAGVGAGVGTIWWLKHENHQTLDAGTEIVFSLDRPLVLSPATYNQ